MLRTIGRQERDALHYVARGWLEDWWMPEGLLRHNKVEAALAERRDLERLFRLLDDLGWALADPRESFTLTMPDTELSTLLSGFRYSALRGIELDVTSDISPEWCEEDVDTVWACNTVLAEAPRGSAVGPVRGRGAVPYLMGQDGLPSRWETD